MNFTVAAKEVSQPRFLPVGALLTVTPASGATATVEYTIDSASAVANRVAVWQVWSKGAVSTATTDLLGEPAFIRVTASGGIVTVDADLLPGNERLRAFRSDWGVASASSSVATSKKTVTTAVGQVSLQYNGTPSSVAVVANLTPVSVNSTATSIEQTVTGITGLVAGDIITNIVFSGTQTAGITLVGWRLISAATGSVALMFKCTGGPLTPAAGNYNLSIARMTGGVGLPHMTLTGTGANTAALTVTTLTGTVQNIPLTSPKIRNCNRLSDWSNGGAAPSNVGLYGPWAATTTTQGNAGQTGTVMRYDFVTDANKIELIMKGTPTFGNLNLVRVLVDGKIVTPDASPLPGNSKTYRMLIDFTQGGAATPANTPRQVRVEICSSAAIQVGDVVIGVLDSIWAPAASSSIRAIIFGDSWTEGFLMPQQYTGYAHQLGYMMGWDDLWVSGVGGTGYLKKVAGTTITWRERIGDITANAPDVVLILGSINDTIGSVFTAAQVQTEATAFYQQLTAALPNTPIFVAGVQITQPNRAASSALNTLATDQNNAIKAAVTGLANVYFIDIVAESWFTGSGTSAATLSDGNADRFLLSDGTHLTQVGHDYLAQRMASAIRTIGKAV